MVSLDSGWEIPNRYSYQEMNYEYFPASNRLFQEVFYLEVDVFYLWGF